MSLLQPLVTIGELQCDLRQHQNNRSNKKALFRPLSSRQKLRELKLKERNRKRKERESNNPSTLSSKPTTPLSTERVREHRENKRLLVNLTSITNPHKRDEPGI